MQLAANSPQGFALAIEVKVAQELSERYKVSRLQFCNKFLGLVKKNSDIVNTVLMSDEVHFKVSGYVNKQKCSYWVPENRHELHRRPLHSAKVTVWCTVYCYGIIGTYFFENGEGCTLSVNVERYKVMLEIFLHVERHPRQQDLSWLQQDGTTVHTEEISMKPLGTVSGQTLCSVGDITWPARSPDIAVQTTSSGATLKTRYTKNVLPILLAEDSEFWSVFKGSPRKYYCVL